MTKATRRMMAGAALALVLGLCGRADAGLTLTMQTELSGPATGTVTGVMYELGVGFSPTIFGVAITASDVGHTFVADSGTDANFDAVVAVLTNGSLDTINDNPAAIGGTLKAAKKKKNEGSVFYGDLLGANGIDLQGYTINKISLTVDALSLIAGVDGDGNPTTQVEFAGTVTFDAVAAVPEPATLSTAALAGVVGLGFAAYRRRMAAATA